MGRDKPTQRTRTAPNAQHTRPGRRRARTVRFITRLSVAIMTSMTRDHSQPSVTGMEQPAAAWTGVDLSREWSGSGCGASNRRVQLRGCVRS